MRNAVPVRPAQLEAPRRDRYQGRQKAASGHKTDAMMHVYDHSLPVVQESQPRPSCELIAASPGAEGPMGQD